MADIMDYLKQIKEAVFGKEVRQAIHDGIQQCYYDGKAGSIDLEGRQIAEAAIETEKTARQKEIAAERARIDRIVNQTNITGIQRMLLVSGETQISNKEEMWGFVWNASGTSDLESIKTKHPFVIDVYLREAGSSNVGISLDTRYRYSIDTSSSTDLTISVTFTNNKVAAEDATEKTYNVEACVILGYDCDIPEENNEIADLRIDVDGNTHESAGSAVRAQIQDLKDDNEQLKNKVEDLSYNVMEITEFTTSVNTAELGSAVDDVTLTWKTNKTPTALSLDGASVDVSATSKALTGLGLTANKSWKLVATDERDTTAEKTTTLNFYNGVYYGVAAESTYDSAFVLALTKVLSGTKARTFIVNAGAGKYIYYCLPSRLGTPSFNVGGFDGGFKKVATIIFTNASGYSEDYDIWKSDNANLGNTTIKVS